MREWMNVRRLTIRTGWILALAALLALTACAEENSVSFFAMDTFMTIRAEGASDALLDACVDRVNGLEKALSVTDPDSEIAALNRGGRAELSDETAFLVRFALDMSRKTGGALDITLYPIVHAWGFTTGEYRVPDDAEIAALLERTGWRRVALTGNEARLEDGMMIDLGAIAKGYASQAAANLLRAGGVATGLIDFGGNIYAIGAKEDGSAWRVGIRDPENLEDYCAVIAVKDRAVVTSGSYERYFEQDGVRYGHIFDPATGRPAQSGLESVTVIGTDGALCDALSTALFVMGPERACSWLADQRDVEAVLVGERFWVTEGLKDSFAPYGAYAGKGVEWIPQ